MVEGCHGRSVRIGYGEFAFGRDEAAQAECGLEAVDVVTVGGVDVGVAEGRDVKCSAVDAVGELVAQLAGVVRIGAVGGDDQWAVVRTVGPHRIEVVGVSVADDPARCVELRGAEPIGDAPVQPVDSVGLVAADLAAPGFDVDHEDGAGVRLADNVFQRVEGLLPVLAVDEVDDQSGEPAGVHCAAGPFIVAGEVVVAVGTIVGSDREHGVGVRIVNGDLPF